MSNALYDHLKKDAKLGAKIKDAVTIAIEDTRFAPKGHPLHHPRADDPADDEEMIADIAQKGIEKALVLYEEVLPDGSHALWVVAGSRRRNHALKAQERLGAGKKIQAPFVLVTGDLADPDDLKRILRRRTGENGERFKKPDSGTVSCVMWKQLVGLGATCEEIASDYRDVTAATVEAVTRFENLPKATRRYFDEGKLPLHLVGTFLDLPADQHEALIAKLVAEGKLTPLKAKRAINKEVRGGAAKSTRLPPTKVGNVAGALEATFTARGERPEDREAARLIWAGVQIASGDEEAREEALKKLPAAFRTIIRDAIAAKKAKGAAEPEGEK